LREEVVLRTGLFSRVRTAGRCAWGTRPASRRARSSACLSHLSYP